MTPTRHSQISEAAGSASFFKKKEAKKLLDRFARSLPGYRQNRARRTKSFLVAFFQKSNVFSYPSFPKALSLSC
jgi:hypothetical protein